MGNSLKNFLTLTFALFGLLLGQACVEAPETDAKEAKKILNNKKIRKKARRMGMGNRKVNPRLLNRAKPKRIDHSNVRYKVELFGEEPYLGEKNALVTIVEYSEFQCPFCVRVEPTLKKILDNYKGKVKIVWKNNPLGFHKNAMPAAEAAHAIFKLKGNDAFWKAHDIFYQNRKNLTRELYEKTAQNLGVDMDKFKEALDKNLYKGFIQKQQRQGLRLGARGTPGFFINGKFLSGAQPYNNFKKIIDQELKFAEGLVKKGTPVSKVYNEVIKNGLGKALPKNNNRRNKRDNNKRQRPGRPDPAKVYYNPADGYPTMGPKDALITIVEYSDYQCPFCKRVEPTIKKIMNDYKGKVRLVWKDNPLSFHKDAMPASQIGWLVFKEKGADAFWKAHDMLYDNNKNLKTDKLIEIAKSFGISEAKAKETLEKKPFMSVIRKAQMEGAKVGARGTPAFFINGRFLSGARPYDHFKKLIDEELKKAEEMVKKGTSASNLYNEIMKKAERKVAAAPQRDNNKRQRPGRPDPAKVYYNPADGYPTMGPKDALITIVEYSDYQCPFCKRVEPTLKKVMNDYKGKVRLVWKDNPLGFHKDAMPAAQIGWLVFKEKGADAFWKAHDMLYDNNKNLKTDKLIEIAKSFGISEAKAKETLEKKPFMSVIRKAQMEGAKVGARGTPAFFINGRFLSGARPYDHFKKLIDEELKKAEEMVKKGIPASKLYNEIMKKAERKVAAAPMNNRRERPVDNKIYDIPKNNHSPYFGGKDAKITIVEFSEFQCPFCNRVMPTINKLKKKYGNKIRLEFRHLPLPFHKNAMNAAKASMAAHKQGKFWQMHDLLFANNKKLTEDDLIGYANKLGLNISQFEADMKDPAIEKMIKDDMKVASKVGARGTPTFFINGKKLVGAQPFENFEKRIEEELKKAK